MNAWYKFKSVFLLKNLRALNHNILIDKLVYYGVTGKSKDLLLHYLTERQQYVDW